MKITFLKDHLEHKKGQTKEVEDLAGKYFILTHVAIKTPQEADREIKKANKGIR
jgi:hypothetical protein